MPSFFTRLLRYYHFREYADSICLTRQGLNDEICRLVKERLQMNELVIVLAQFKESFSRIQNDFDEAGVNYSIQSSQIDSDEIQRLIARSTEQSAVLSLPQMLPDSSLSQLAYNKKEMASVMVVERHPLPTCDEQIITAARNFPVPTRIGFFLAMDDPMLAPMNADWVGYLLRQMGSTETELISSQMVSRRVRALQRRFQNRLDGEQLANSAEQWIKLNASWATK